MNVKNKSAQAAVQAELCPDARHLLALQCTWDIDGIADAVNGLADEVAAGEIAIEPLLRCYGMRLSMLNSLVMSYLDNETGLTAEDMHKALFGRMRKFERAEA